jgi:hypothetical protein
MSTSVAMPDDAGEPIRMSGLMRLSHMFPDPTHQQQIIRDGKLYRGKRELVVRTREIPGSDDREILAMAAVSRDPGRADDFLDLIADFQASNKTQANKVSQYWQHYANAGVVNNAVNKVASILSGSGSFKVRQAKKGKKQKVVDELGQILYHWQRLINADAKDGVVTGAQGLKAINHQAVRYALVEGSWIGRTVWGTIDLSDFGLGQFDAPTQIQSISTANIEILRESIGTGMELYFWVPDNALIQLIRNPTKETRQLLKRFVPNDVQRQLKNDGKALLDPALMVHVKNRGVDNQAFGESFIHPALQALAYHQAIMRLDTVSMQNLINRLTIVMVGADEGPYARPEVSETRMGLMNQFFEDPGPNMTIVWAGNDVEVVDVGAHSSVLALEDRFRLADAQIKAALGIPDALLTGTTNDGKAAGWAATIGAAAQLEELANQFANAWTEMGNRIAFENGYTNVDLVYEFDRSLLVDRAEEQTQIRNNYVVGGASIYRWLKVQGVDPEAEFQRKCYERGLDPDAATWEAAFTAPQGLQGQGGGAFDPSQSPPTHNPVPGDPQHDPNLPPGAPTGAPGAPQGTGPGKTPGQGRTPDNQTDKTTPERKKERTSPKENK